MTDFKQTRKLFHIPEGVTYFDGNSLGPLPIAATDKVQTMMRDEWGEMLIRGWNDAGWMEQPALVGDRVARLVGAPKGSVVMGDTLTIKVYQAVASALRMRESGKVVLSDTGNFPSDLYVTGGLLDTLNTANSKTASENNFELRLVEPEQIEDSINDSVAVVLLTQVDYRTGRLHDMKALTEKAHQHGAIIIWDLAHSAGAVEVQLQQCDVDFAVGCTYKFLNSGPGGPAFIYVNPTHSDIVKPALSGWLGHEAPFAFDLDYRPGKGIDRMRVGTPPIIQLASLQASLDIWDTVDMKAVRERSIELSELFITKVEAICPQLKLACPRDPLQRGSQVSFSFEHGYAVMQALIKQGVIGDFRAPNIMRFGITPLYQDETDVERACQILKELMQSSGWDKPEFHQRSTVT